MESRQRTASFVQVETAEQMQAVERLAGVIWREHYTPIIGVEQVEYMLRKFQSAEAIAGQISKESYEYYLLELGSEKVGYLALIPDEEACEMMLSKIYVAKERRGEGLGKAALDFAASECAKRGFGKLWLTVNKHNSASIAWYEKMGFVNAGPTVSEIGNGFVMDDYRMELFFT